MKIDLSKNNIIADANAILVNFVFYHYTYIFTSVIEYALPKKEMLPYLGSLGKLQ